VGQAGAVRAPAKLTVSLRVTGVRADGYHLLESEMVAIDLADELAFDPDGDGLEVIGATGLEVPANDDNLVRRALVAVGRTAHVTLRKRIPAGAGLGGGSADAAAVLRWAGRGDDVELAATLGADVPFCLAGGGRAIVRGIGDELAPLPFVARTYTLLVPPFGVSTVAVYRAWDALGGPAGGAGANDLEPAALHVEPRLAEWRDRLGDATGQTPVLAGSGGTWFVEGEFPGGDRIVTNTIRS
jgi:4-diphosphocytidyl-2-C-methyl-D-erythritol kinase